MNTIDVIVTTTAVDSTQLQSLTARLVAAGLQDAQPLESLGMITGKAGSDTIDALRGIPGVETLECSGCITLPPPDAGIQ